MDGRHGDGHRRDDGGAPLSSTDTPPGLRMPDGSGRVTVRPYVRTRGRTRAPDDLRVETLVSIPVPGPAMEDPEHRVIAGVCDGPRSVAEVAALLEVPIGVARVLIGDMVASGRLVVHPHADGAVAPDSGRSIMERVLDGLRRL